VVAEYATQNTILFYTWITRRFQVCLPGIQLQIMILQSTGITDEIPHQTVVAKDVAISTRLKTLTVYLRVRCSSCIFINSYFASARDYYIRLHQCRALRDSSSQSNFITNV
jgi:hypothetical protein